MCRVSLYFKAGQGCVGSGIGYLASELACRFLAELINQKVFGVL